MTYQEANHISIKDYLKSVSYTHLDVYKRQSHKSGSTSSPVEYWLTFPSRVTRPIIGHLPFFFTF